MVITERVNKVAGDKDGRFESTICRLFSLATNTEALSVIGEHGANLSVAHRQRLGISRRHLQVPEFSFGTKQLLLWIAQRRLKSLSCYLG
jgi:hypothetical protein